MFLVRAPAAASTGTGEAAWRAQWCTRRAVRLPLGDRLTRHPEQDSQTLLGEATTGPQVLKVLTKGHGNSCTQAVGEAADIRFPCSGSSSTVPVRTMHIHHPTVAIHPNLTRGDVLRSQGTCSSANFRVAKGVLDKNGTRRPGKTTPEGHLARRFHTCCQLLPHK